MWGEDHKCNKCELSFLKISCVDRHLESVPEKKLPFECKICDYSWSLKGIVKKRIELVQEKKETIQVSNV